ncbi:MAG: hypothetical protein LUD69_00205 [Oscillospiraceae bacterium]|nr:hypothetical protein [Oscillospiraceae bacterium]
MRGRVMAALWVTLVSALLLTGTTFAWVTLSTSPEVTGVTTTITTNGALEIALSDADGEEPDSSAVGDSMAASGQSVTVSNLTWGNLVNLSDSSYGLGDIILRPAVLNLVGLQTSPLQAVSYGADGRASAYMSSFGYAASYDSGTGTFSVAADPEDEDNTSYMEYGVRAISYVTYEDMETMEVYIALKNTAYTLLAQADMDYSEIVNNQDYIDALANVLEIYILNYYGETLDTSAYSEATAAFLKAMFTTSEDCSAYIEQIYNMAVDLQTVYQELGEAYAAIAMLQQAAANDGAYDEWTMEALLAAEEADLTAAGIEITALSMYEADYEALRQYVLDLESCYSAYMNNQTAVMMDDIEEMLEFLVDPLDATVNGSRVSDTDGIIGQMSVGLGSAENSAKSNPTMTVLTDGAVYRLESQLQSRVSGYSLITVALGSGNMTVVLYVNVTTGADTMTAWTDYTSAAGVTSFAGTDAVANETYAMAVDLWVRTNAAGTYLTLEGEIQTDEETGQVTGYAGSNRVWEDYELTTNGAATTQGMGSCYVFTCDDPVEALRITELLDAMTVAFVDADGALLGYADLDTDHIWQDYGRYVVPLTVRSTGSNYVTGTDEDGEETTTYYITSLAQNQAQRITAILYLDGTRLTNEQASAAQDIEGQLNIQFGTTGSLTPADNEALYSETIFLDSISPAETTLAYTGQTQSVTLTAQLSGDGVSADSAVTGYFLRAINSSQGVPQETLTFTYADGAWTAQADFTEPGEYVLTRLTVDGVSYSLSDLSNEAYTAVGVTVEGYALTAVSLEEDELFSTGSSASTGVTFTVTDTTGAVESVSALFLSADGKTVRAEMTCANQSAGTWTGTAAFSTSGTYTLSYVYLNGDAYAVSDTLQETVAVTLGVGARVWIVAADGTSFADGESATYFTIPDEGMKLTARVELTDNAGSALEGLNNDMTLHYLSAVGGMELDTDLTWNASTGYYEGDINVALGGIYSFRSITLDSNTISRVTYAPTITAVATGEPEYYGDSTAASQMVLTSTAYLSLDILNGDTEGLTVSAVVLDEDAQKSYTVEGTLETTYLTSAAQSVSTYTFAVPTDEDGATQDGYYSVTSLTLSGYTDENGQEAETTVALSDVQTKVVSTVYASVDYSGETDLTEPWRADLWRTFWWTASA